MQQFRRGPDTDSAAETDEFRETMSDLARARSSPYSASWRTSVTRSSTCSASVTPVEALAERAVRFAPRVPSRARRRASRESARSRGYSAGRRYG